MIKKIFQLNKSDFVFFSAVEVVAFLIWELIEAVILLALKPDTSAALGAVLIPVIGGFVLLFINSANINVNYDLLLRFSVIRKTALLGTVLLMLTEALFAMGLGWLLGQADRAIAHAWTSLPWVEAVDIDISFPLWGLALAAVILTLFALGTGAMLQRFGRKAFWILWAVWMFFVVFMNEIDWDHLFAVSWIVPTLAIGALLLGAWGAWSLLRATVRQ